MAEINDSARSFTPNTIIKEEPMQLQEIYYDNSLDDIDIKYEPKYAEVNKELFLNENDLASNTVEAKSLNSGCNKQMLLNIKSEEESESYAMGKMPLPNSFIVNSSERLQENLTSIAGHNNEYRLCFVTPRLNPESVRINSYHDGLSDKNREASHVNASDKADRINLSASKEIDLNSKTEKSYVSYVYDESILLKSRAKFNCRECSYVTKYSNSLMPHIKSHRKFDTLSCDGCDFRSTPMALRHHQYKCQPHLVKFHWLESQKDKNQPSRFSCTECSYITKRAHFLKIHMRTHRTWQKISKCNACDFKSTPDALRHHEYRCKAYLMKNNVPERPKYIDGSDVTCSECSYVTRFEERGSKMTRHQETHKKFQNFSCDGCGFKSTPVSLRFHQYKCEAYYLLKNLSPQSKKIEAGQIMVVGPNATSTL